MAVNFCVGLGTGFLLGFLTYKLYRQSKLNVKYKYFKYVIVVRTDIEIGKAEAADHCSSVTLESYKKADEITPDFVRGWERNSQPKIVVRIDKNFEEEVRLLKTKAEDLGLVLVALNTAKGVTVVGIGPGPADSIDKVSGHLKLLS